jgi:hypothetical protein
MTSFLSLVELLDKKSYDFTLTFIRNLLKMNIDAKRLHNDFFFKKNLCVSFRDNYQFFQTL